MQTIEVNGEAREGLGKRATKAVRNSGKIPCVIHGDNETLHFTTTLNDVRHLIYTPEFKLADVKIDGKGRQCFVKEIQFHPVTDEILHLDLMELVPGRTIKVEVPLKFRGTSPGVRTGGKLIQSVRRIKIKTTPENLIDALYADISKLKLGQAVRVRDIDAVDGIEIMNSPGIPIASVEIPRALRSANAAAAKAGAGAGDDEDSEGGEEDGGEE
ncbi:MAG: 50S ribosomal protein L25 [Saprospiraceae bacterium]|nr:50S ribosomal protein L25 [Saprospiraceae bacterium]